MTNIEKKLRIILFKVGLYEDFFSALLGGIVVFVVSFVFLNFLKSRQYKNIITDEAASTVNEELIRKEDSGFPKKYIVKEGDYLAKIALENYGNSEVWNKIAEENEIYYVDFLEVGKEINLPMIENVFENEQKVLSLEKTEIFHDDKYVVKLGDNLFLISEKVYGDGTKWGEISKANALWNPDLLEVGMELFIPR